ncbi:DUF4294 domain-containing protein [Carboxylicivirga sp. N1Y132]|uniref:DUF4294 domain-containing protein n=2 Tax=Carboxylicivirga marina TaxID=2800988 RepID=A0ABS1HI16_9BACT|nr:DUF4294 domain-containing protein [Carboxylicivirga marina]
MSLGLIISFQVQTTEGQELADSINLVLQHRIVENDTIPHVNLKEIPIIPPYKFKNKRHKRRYGKLVRNIKKVLPFARSAGERINDINAHLATLSSEKEKKDYLNEAEEELFNEFERPLRKLTFSQGRLLIKLINRETGDTTYELIKQYKGGVSAFFWQGIARLFGSNLKSEYHKDGDDQMIEHIILLIDNGII